MCIDFEVVDKIDEISVKFNLAAIWFWNIFYVQSHHKTHSNSLSANVQHKI